jgi:hypothetical protein
MSTISFDHSNLYSNTGLVPSSSFKVGHGTSITISLFNSGAARSVSVHLWWIGPTLSTSTGPMVDLVNCNKLVPPYCITQPIVLTVEPSSGHTPGGQIVVSWIPSATDFPKTLGSSVPGSLFAQVEILAAPPTYPGDTSALTNWSPAYTLCAQHNIQIST